MRPSPTLKPTFWASLIERRPDRAQSSSGLASVILVAIRAYKLLISPLFAGCCRFNPSCADYMAEAVRVHGAGRGVWMGLRRLSRCRPLGGHGLDPVPRA